jgi:hypothetical protein
MSLEQRESGIHPNSHRSSEGGVAQDLVQAVPE